MPEPSSTDSTSGSAHREPSRDRGPVLLGVVVVVAAVALGLSAWSLLRPAPSPGSAASEISFTDAQRAEAKTKICKVFDTVRKGVTQNTNLQPPGGPDDVVGSLAVAANARLSLYDGGQYLLARLDPGTPADLTNAIRSFANNLMDIGAAATAGAVNTEPEQAARLREAETLNGTVVALCQ